MNKIDKLMELKKLYEHGILTNQEMEIEKKKILGENSKGEHQSSNPPQQMPETSKVSISKESYYSEDNQEASFQKFKGYIFAGIGILIAVSIYLFHSNIIKKESQDPPTVAEIIKELEADVEDDIGVESNSELSQFEMLMKNGNWKDSEEGGFRYPDFFKHSETFVEDVPGAVTVYNYEPIELCYWPMLGVWSTETDFVSDGLVISPTEKVKNVTYKVESKGIASGYTHSGKIYYLKRRIMSGGLVDHGKILVVINPPEYNKSVESITKMIAKW